MEAAGFTGLVTYPHLFNNLRLLPTNQLGAQPTPDLNVHGKSYQDTAFAWGLTHEAIPFSYQTDRYGFRNAIDRKDADIYLVGDSIIVAGLVAFGDTLSARLEQSLGRTVMNVALIGIGPQEEHELFRAAGLLTEGRLVLQFLFEGNDLTDSAKHSQASGDGGDLNNSILARSFSYNTVLALQRITQPVVGLARKRTCRIAGHTYTFRWTVESHVGLEGELNQIFSAVGQFASVIEASGGQFAVVFVPAKLRVLGPVCESWPDDSDLIDTYEANPFRSAVHEWANETGISLIDLTEPLRQSAREGAVPWFWGDTHWNEFGHKVVAQVLGEAKPVRFWINRNRAAEQRVNNAIQIK